MPWQINGDKMKATLLNWMGNDNTVVDAARVSFDKESSQFAPEQNERLIKYLAEHNHYSPFGHCFASFRVSAPIFVRAQLGKHEYLRINEISRRYVDSTPKFYTPDIWRGRPVGKKQGSSGEVKYFIEDLDLYGRQLLLYEDMLREGVAPEMARMVLPQSMYTEWYWSGSLDAFANMAKLRCKPDTQEETRLIANQISEQMLEKFPVSWKALTEF